MKALVAQLVVALYDAKDGDCVVSILLTCSRAELLEIRNEAALRTRTWAVRHLLDLVNLLLRRTMEA